MLIVYSNLFKATITQLMCLYVSYLIPIPAQSPSDEKMCFSSLSSAYEINIVGRGKIEYL